MQQMDPIKTAYMISESYGYLVQTAQTIAEEEPQPYGIGSNFSLVSAFMDHLGNKSNSLHPVKPESVVQEPLQHFWEAISKETKLDLPINDDLIFRDYTGPAQLVCQTQINYKELDITGLEGQAAREKLAKGYQSLDLNKQLVLTLGECIILEKIPEDIRDLENRLNG